MPATQNEQLLINRLKTVTTSLGWKPVSEETTEEKIKVVIETPKPKAIAITTGTLAVLTEKTYQCQFPPDYKEFGKTNRDQFITGSPVYNLLNSGYKVIIGPAGEIIDIWDPVRNVVLNTKRIAIKKRAFPWCETKQANDLTIAAKKKAVVTAATEAKCPTPCQTQIDALNKRVTALERRE
jgi:hypothetical protein